MQSGKRVQKNGRLIRKTTIKNYLALKKNLTDYSNEKGIVLRIRDYERLGTTRARIRERNYWRRFYFSFTEFLYQKCDLYDNYVGTQIKLLRAFFNYQNNEMDPTPGNYHNRFYVTSEETPVLVLIPERLNFLIYNKEFENSLPKRLRVMKDIFVFGCITALRFGDLIKANRTNIEYINKNVYMCTTSQKSNIRSRVYLPDFAKEILLKYKRRKRTLFPPISNVNFNIAIKKIALLAGWTEEIEVTRSKRGEHHEKFKDEKKAYYRFCDLIASHAMRRTAITTMLRMGMHEMNVRIISGHKANSTSFCRYVSYADGFMDEVLEKHYAKMAAIKPLENNPESARNFLD
jgi:hypothetical protein